MSADQQAAPQAGARKQPAGGPGGAGGSGVALEKAIQYVTWLVPTLEDFPRSQKFLLGDRLQSLALDAIEALDATYTKAPQATLRRVNLLLEKQRVLVRVAYNLRYLDVRRYELAGRKLDDIGQSVGGWLKKLAPA